MTMRAVWVGVLGVGLMAAAGRGESAATGVVPDRLATGGVLSSLTAAPVIGQPFSAVQVTRTAQTLADGTTIKHHGHHDVARDQEGRLRVEMRLRKAVGEQPETVMVFVMDPIAHTLTTWVTGPTDGKKVAAVVKLPKGGLGDGMGKPTTAPSATTADPGRPKDLVTREDLGPRTWEGLPVEVVKTTTVMPIGRSGNDAPITRTHEVWTSPDLQLVVKQVWVDPRTGERTVELEHFSRAQPDAAMFRAPQGYEVKDAMETLKDVMAKLEAAQQN